MTAVNAITTWALSVMFKELLCKTIKYIIKHTNYEDKFTSIYEYNTIAPERIRNEKATLKMHKL